MPSCKEIHTEWKAVRSALGNLICYIDSKATRYEEAETVWQMAYEQGFEDGYKAGVDDSKTAVKTNADKFVEVFGFRPGYEEDGKRVYYPLLQEDFWNAEYKEQEEAE